jgi:hypothetical protein
VSQRPALQRARARVLVRVRAPPRLTRRAPAPRRSRCSAPTLAARLRKIACARTLSSSTSCSTR